MIQFIVYFIWGFLLVIPRTALNYSHDRYAIADFAAFISCTSLFAAAAPLGLFMPRLSAMVALGGIFVSLAGAFIDAFLIHDFVLLLSLALFINLPPTLVAFYSLWETREQKTLAVRRGKWLPVRVALAVLTLGLFGFVWVASLSS